MMNLDNKIPPPVIALFFIAMIYLTRGFATAELPFQNVAAAVILAAAVATMIFGVLEFRRLETTVNPLKPESSSTLVTSGVFRFSRNPMYLGMLGVLLAVSTFFGALTAVVILPLFILYMNAFQIAPEEAAMEKLFGDEYKKYRAEVRRWI